MYDVHRCRAGDCGGYRTRVVATQQLAILQRGPAHLLDAANGEFNWEGLVKQNAHRGPAPPGLVLTRQRLAALTLRGMSAETDQGSRRISWRESKSQSRVRENRRRIIINQLNLIPTQRPTRLILDHPRLKKVFLFLKVDQFAHPRERIVCARIKRVDADLLAAAVGDEA